MSNYKEILSILTKHDPIGIILENNFGEYEPEAKSIYNRLNNTNSVQEVSEIVYEEFINWFDKDTVGGREKYDFIAKEIYLLLNKT